MKKYINILLTALVLGFGSVLTADAQSNRDFRPDFDYYDEEFDWRWDVRVRISDGINSGLITRWEANRLYRKLENIEEKEYAYLADGFYEPWEQDDVWRDVQWLNSRVGLELRDFDRTYYGFNPIGIGFTGYPSWWYNGGYNFYRFDRWGWGSIRRGYAARCFVPLWVPNRVVYVNNYRNYGHRYYRDDSRRNSVVRYTDNGNRSRNVNRSPRNSGRNDRTTYNRNGSNARRGSASASRSAAVSSRSATSSRSTARTRSNSGRSESLNRTSSTNNRSREINRPTTRSSSRSRSVAPSSSSRRREISRPSTSSRRSVAPSRSSAGRSESLNRSSRSSSSRSTVNRSSSRPSSSRSSSVSRSSSNRTKAPTASRSTSSRSRSSSSATRSSRREN